MKSNSRINVAFAISLVILLSIPSGAMIVNGQVSSSISLSPISGSQGDTVKISGNGFTPDDKIVIYFGKTVVGSAVTLSDGSFSASFAVPSTSDFVLGNYTVSASDSKGLVGSATFTISGSNSQQPSPSISIKPTSGTQGSYVTVQGSNFTPNDKVAIYFGKTSVSSAATASDGSFSTSFAVPSTSDFTAGNSYSITAIDSQNLQGSSSFTVSSSAGQQANQPTTPQSTPSQGTSPSSTAPSYVSPSSVPSTTFNPSSCSSDFSSVSIDTPTRDQIFQGQANVTISGSYHSSFPVSEIYANVTDHAPVSPYIVRISFTTPYPIPTDGSFSQSITHWFPQYTEADDMDVTVYIVNSCHHVIASDTIPYHSNAVTTPIPYHSWRIDYNQWISTHCRDAPPPTILNILVIPAKYSDDARTPGTPMDFRSIQDRLEYISDYFYQQSMCHIRINSHFITNPTTPDGWFSLPHTSNYYHSTIPPDPSNANENEKAWIFSDGYTAAQNAHFVLTGYNAIVVIHTGGDRDITLLNQGDLDAGGSAVRDMCNAMSASGSCALDFGMPQFTHILQQPSVVVRAVGDQTEAWVHELGHALFTYWDFYDRHEFSVRGLMGYWDIMANPGTNPPPPISVVNRERSGWLTYSELPHDTGPIALRPLSEMRYGDPVYTYQLGDFFGPSTPKYIFELRNGPDGVTSAPEQDYTTPSLPRTAAGLEIYREYGAGVSRADSYLHPTCGSVDEITSIFLGAIIHHGFDSCTYATYNVMTYHNMNVARNSTTLTAGQTYDDNFAGIQFTLNSDGRTLTISHSPHSTIVVSLSSGTNGPSSGWFGSLLTSSGTPMLQADIQAYSNDQKHVGPNYTTGNYDVDIPGAEVGGALTPIQWISIPDNIAASYVIDGTQAITLAKDNGVTSPVIHAQVNIVHYDSNGLRTLYPPINYTLNSDNPQTEQIQVSSSPVPEFPVSFIVLIMALFAGITIAITRFNGRIFNW